MNISGVTQTAPILPQNYGMAQMPDLERIPESPGEMSAIEASMAMSVRVQDLALSSFEDAAAQLIEALSAMTGVGQNIDIYA